MNTYVLETSKEFFNNIDDLGNMNLKEEKFNISQNTKMYPPFRYYNDDTNLNLMNKVVPSMIYKNKSIFGVEKPIQTENDEETINGAFFNNYYGYTDYGNFKYQNSQFPEYLKHNITPKKDMFELF